MTYEDFYKNADRILADAEKYNQWRREAKEKLLTDIAPRIAAIGKKGYLGCGFHYEKERRFGKLLVTLTEPWQPSGNHHSDIKERYAGNIITKLLFKNLVEDVEEAEKTIDKP